MTEKIESDQLKSVKYVSCVEVNGGTPTYRTTGLEWIRGPNHVIESDAHMKATDQV
jgi:hypothetical protein